MEAPGLVLDSLRVSMSRPCNVPCFVLPHLVLPFSSWPGLDWVLEIPSAILGWGGARQAICVQSASRFAPGPRPQS